MTGPGAIGPATPAYLPTHVDETAASDGTTTPYAGMTDDYTETYDLNRDGVVTPEEVQRRDYAERWDTASSLPFLHTGPRLLHLDRGWTPQGQGYDTGRDELLTTYYYGDRILTPWDESKLLSPWEGGGERGVLLSVQDRATGVEARQVTLLGPEDGSAPAPAHGGGVSTDGEHVYVADSGEIHVYSRAAIDRATVDPATGRAEVPALHVIRTPGLTGARDDELVSSASYLAVHDGYAYVGGYSKDGDGKTGAVWRYEINDDGSFVEPPLGPIKAPDRAQGVTVVGNGDEPGLLFTTGDRKLVYQPITAADAGFATSGDRSEVDNGQLDSWAQGINIIDGELYVTYESGSRQYEGDEGRQSIQRIALEGLDDFPGSVSRP